jgi:hypothetical protein
MFGGGFMLSIDLWFGIDLLSVCIKNFGDSFQELHNKKTSRFDSAGFFIYLRLTYFLQR